MASTRTDILIWPTTIGYSYERSSRKRPDSLHANDPVWCAQPVAQRRARLHAAIDGALEQGSRRQADKAQGQSLLFGGDAADEAPAAQSLPNEVKFKVEAMDEIKSANVEIVFDPPWTPNKMSDAAKLTLNIL